ncbi:hypothetical protein GEMRC1_013904 [Eukaryota sp. GEM-RC1]
MSTAVTLRSRRKRRTPSETVNSPVPPPKLRKKREVVPLSPSESPKTRGSVRRNSVSKTLLQLGSFPSSISPDDALSLLRLFRLGYNISADDLLDLFKLATTAFSALPNVSTVAPTPSQDVVIVGDLHAQFYDLYDNILSVHGLPSESPSFSLLHRLNICPSTPARDIVPPPC